MKTIILFLITMVISTGALLASLSMKTYPYIGPAISFAVVLLFLGYITGKSRRRSRQREKERLFYQYFIALQNKRSRFY